MARLCDYGVEELRMQEWTVETPPPRLDALPE